MQDTTTGMPPALSSSSSTTAMGQILQISGERSREQEDKGDTWHRVERGSGRFSRRFRLPENAKLEEVKANMEDGILIVTVPEEEVKKPDVNSIKISG